MSSFLSYAQARTQNDPSLLNVQKFKRWLRNRFLVAFCPAESWTHFANVIVLECQGLLSPSQSSRWRTTEKLGESVRHRIQPCLHGYPEHLASREAPVITPLAIRTADKLTLSFRENVWALKGGEQGGDTTGEKTREGQREKQELAGQREEWTAAVVWYWSPSSCERLMCLAAARFQLSWGMLGDLRLFGSLPDVHTAQMERCKPCTVSILKHILLQGWGKVPARWGENRGEPPRTSDGNSKTTGAKRDGLLFPFNAVCYTKTGIFQHVAWCKTSDLLY